MIKDREIVDVNLSICELLAVSYCLVYETASSSQIDKLTSTISLSFIIYIYIYIYI